MIVSSKYAKVFNSDMLTRSKYDELYAVAVNLRNFKNEVSQLVNDNLLYYLEFSKLDFIKEMRKTFPNKVSSCFDAQQYIQVHKDYQNKFNAILRNIEFKKITFKGFELYKRNSKKHKKGDLKKYYKRIITNKPYSMFIIFSTLWQRKHTRIFAKKSKRIKRVHRQKINKTNRIIPEYY